MRSLTEKEIELIAGGDQTSRASIGSAPSGSFSPGSFSPGSYSRSLSISSADDPGTDPSGKATSAVANGTTVTYFGEDGSVVETITGTHPNRDNNPLDLESQDLPNQIGNDGVFAIFSDAQSGYNAATYSINLHDSQDSLAQIVNNYSPASDHNDPQGIMSYISSVTGLSSTDAWNSLTADQQAAFLTAYGTKEGFKGAADE